MGKLPWPGIKYVSSSCLGTHSRCHYFLDVVLQKDHTLATPSNIREKMSCCLQRSKWIFQDGSDEAPVCGILPNWMDVVINKQMQFVFTSETYYSNSFDGLASVEPDTAPYTMPFRNSLAARCEKLRTSADKKPVWTSVKVLFCIRWNEMNCTFCHPWFEPRTPVIRGVVSLSFLPRPIELDLKEMNA